MEPHYDQEREEASITAVNELMGTIRFARWLCMPDDDRWFGERPRQLAERLARHV
jgi:hypothetical protein